MKKGEVIKSCDNMSKDIDLINKYTKRELSLEEVYTFKVVLCDNDIDRDFERFTVESLFALEKLFVGKTGIFDHNPKALNQTSRIYDCYVESVENKVTETGDQYFRLVAKAYIPRKNNEDIIEKIDSGILKEVSVGCSVDKVICSVCNGELGSGSCTHRKGVVYGGNLCFGELISPKDAYEWSFVSVPSQKNAGVIKNYTPFYGKEKNMKEIMKALKTEEATTLNKSEKEALLSYIGELLEKSRDGEFYRKNLVDDVVKFSLVEESGIGEEIMRKMMEGLSTKEILKVHKSLEKKACKDFPVPQLAISKGDEKHRENTDYRI